ncbi:acetylglucosaminyltransferase [Schizosaccharomyces cryophilus OY26]|uniref:Acetylglucosaminyltransferase n=1 Tax=Schizosaccharomyces cryophilus (strain OY26 / ATCC MYA-4695 / CBS 11777 / NBRC 106824 / NRRL Y48691) TaxID=653667 RepID=S9XA38_SCHCR|nr:acetylglucosaminyltransferase [Schizosaccharomyces cryophilus OY26]EPY54002.1 acetylglucosaminyltransferase [Schizosaccharomyces cryophilus OY26]
MISLVPFSNSISTRQAKRYCIFLLISVVFLILTWECMYLYKNSPDIQRSVNSLAGRTPSKSFAFVTMLLASSVKGDETNQPVQDWYYNATRLLVYRLSHYPETKSRFPIIVMATKGVENWKLDQLKDDGAIVEVVDPLYADDVVDNINDMAVLDTRWSMMFTKLRIFEMYEYDRLCFLDSDILPIRNIDEVFNVHQQSSIYLSSLEIYNKLRMYLKGKNWGEDFSAYEAQRKDFYPYVFAAVSDPGLWHDTPPNFRDYFNAGLFVFHPSTAHYKRLMTLARFPKLYDNANMMEQSLLNFAYSSAGQFPWERLDWTYNGVWTRKPDLAYLKTVHGKLWQEEGSMGYDPDTSALWWDAFHDMEDFYAAHSNTIGRSTH